MDAPKFDTTTERLYDRLPDVYRETDADTDFSFKKYIAAIAGQLGDVDLLVERFRYRSQIEIERRNRYAQRNTIYTHPDRVLNAPLLGSTSDLVDPASADYRWLPWLAQLVGVQLDPNAGEIVNRDAIRYASSGFRAGSKNALEKAVRGVLTGSKYAVAMPHTKVNDQGSIVPGTVWDITILTRVQESPSSFVVLQAVNRDTLKPAGVKLYHRTYQASWDALEASLPYWVDWESKSWDVIEQAGLAYTLVPGNILQNPSFEVNTDGWSSSGPASIARVNGGTDGAGRLRFEHQGAGTKKLVSPTFSLTGNEGWLFSFTYQSTQPFTASLVSDGTALETVSCEATSANTNRRVNSGIMPTENGTYTIEITFTEGVVNDVALFDSFVVRKA